VHRFDTLLSPSLAAASSRHPRALSRHVPRKRHITSASRLLSSKYNALSFNISPSPSPSPSLPLSCTVPERTMPYYTAYYAHLCSAVAPHCTFRTSYFVTMSAFLCCVQSVENSDSRCAERSKIWSLGFKTMELGMYTYEAYI
jgi:hypothetical protein